MGRGSHTTVCTCLSENSLKELIPSFYPRSPRNRTRVIGLGSRCLHQQSHLLGPFNTKEAKSNCVNILFIFLPHSKDSASLWAQALPWSLLVTLSEFYQLTHSVRGTTEILSLQRHSQQRKNNAYGIKTTFLPPPMTLGLIAQRCKREEKCSRVVSRPEDLPSH